jgi:hypothetical protein
MEPRDHGMEHQAHVHPDACLRAPLSRAQGQWLASTALKSPPQPPTRGQLPIAGDILLLTNRLSTSVRQAASIHPASNAGQAFAQNASVAGRVGIEDGRVEAARDSVGNRAVIIVYDAYDHWRRGDGCNCDRVTNGLSMGEGIGRKRRGRRNTGDHGCSKQNDGSARHD